jgi:LSD1 subclass zinc finger protein
MTPDHLFQACPACRGARWLALPDGSGPYRCACCQGEGFVASGLTTGQTLRWAELEADRDRLLLLLDRVVGEDPDGSAHAEAAAVLRERADGIVAARARAGESK